MTDAAFVFKSTNAERANLRRSASHRKTGKSKFCKLPSDNLSRKEWEAKNGPCEGWKMTDFYTWEEFKLMPEDIQVNYLSRLVEVYDVGLENISMDLFSRSKSALWQYLHKRHLDQRIVTRQKGKHVDTAKLESFRTDIRLFWEGTKEMKKEETEMETMEPITNVQMELVDPVQECPAAPTQVQHQVFSTTYISDHVDLKQIEAVAGMFENGASKLRVIFEVEVL